MAFVDQSLQPGADAPYPELGGGETTVEKEEAQSLVQHAQQAAHNTMDSIVASPAVQAVAHGPAADKARAEAHATRSELAHLAASRHAPAAQTAAGQDLTHYHSFFYHLLAWETPRATAVTYATCVLAILIARYVPLVHYLLKGAYVLLGTTAALEAVGRVALGQGVASRMRPRAYYRIPPEAVETALADLAELVNFFVIEFQRIVFAENISATILAFLTAFTAYWLLKVVPSWAFALLSTTVAFFAPLVYITHKDLIDEHLGHAHKMASEQVSQVRGLAAEHTGKAWEAGQAALKDVGAKASGALGQGKQAAVGKGLISPETAEKLIPASPVMSDDFPSAPMDSPLVPEAAAHDDTRNGPHEPLLA